MGPVELDGEVEGFWAEDQWAGQRLRVPIRARASVDWFIVTGYLPEHAPVPLVLRATCGLQDSEMEVHAGMFDWEIPAKLAAGETVELTILAKNTWTPSTIGVGTDERALSFVLQRIEAT